MMHHLKSALIIVVVLMMSLGLTTSDHNKATKLNLKLRVTSTRPENVLSFDAAYLLGGRTGKPQFGKHQTPYERSISVDNEYVAGLFSKTAGDGSIKVEIVLESDGRDINRIEGSGSIVVVSTNREFSSAADNYSVSAFGAD
jgi:hypothetical protein